MKADFDILTSLLGVIATIAVMVLAITIDWVVFGTLHRIGQQAVYGKGRYAVLCSYLVSFLRPLYHVASWIAPCYYTGISDVLTKDRYKEQRNEQLEASVERCRQQADETRKKGEELKAVLDAQQASPTETLEPMLSWFEREHEAALKQKAGKLYSQNIIQYEHQFYCGCALVTPSVEEMQEAWRRLETEPHVEPFFVDPSVEVPPPAVHFVLHDVVEPKAKRKVHISIPKIDLPPLTSKQDKATVDRFTIRMPSKSPLQVERECHEQKVAAVMKKVIDYGIPSHLLQHARDLYITASQRSGTIRFGLTTRSDVSADQIAECEVKRDERPIYSSDKSLTCNNIGELKYSAPLTRFDTLLLAYHASRMGTTISRFMPFADLVYEYMQDANSNYTTNIHGNKFVTRIARLNVDDRCSGSFSSESLPDLPARMQKRLLSHLIAADKAFKARLRTHMFDNGVCVDSPDCSAPIAIYHRDLDFLEIAPSIKFDNPQLLAILEVAKDNS